ncbi:alpha-(1-3)-fucosyltransferase C-like [Brachionus plicatilis]|uniref:Fucosyltransferase n=1 Tax=Brachionus plicatilis TaxID=10195 RepID=A0A3M7QV52_BRAPC|nr:alpha-(1-3)-fucosyltransferase C-like [Brachionus plicatilis]
MKEFYSSVSRNYKFEAENFKVVIDGVQYPQSIPLNLNKTINFNCLNSIERKAKILFWTPFFGDPKFAFGLGYKQPFIDNLCPVYNCEIFNDKSRVNEADIVIVHMRDSIKEFPANRPKNQRWVTLLGKCGIRCIDFFKKSSNENCKELVANSHKFYLSFENSICNGYISEKFFQILRYDIIPVVLGGGNYSYFIPKTGYINVLDYKTPKDLADYLLYLEQNKTAGKIIFVTCVFSLTWKIIFQYGEIPLKILACFGTKIQIVKFQNMVKMTLFIFNLNFGELFFLNFNFNRRDIQKILCLKFLIIAL